VVDSPAKAEVYLNNRLLSTLELPPGPFRLENLPYKAGFNHIRVVVTDAEGKTQVFDSRYVQFSRLLKPGLSEFLITAGSERQNFGTDNFRYDDTLRILGFYRQGVLTNLTLGGRIEATDQLISTGVSVSTALPLGTVDVAAAVSSNAGVMGHAVAVSYFDTLAAGDYSAQVRFEQEVCTFSLTIPESEELFVELGTLTCVLP